MYNEEELKMAQQIMAESPGMSPQQALENARDIISGQRDVPPAGPVGGPSVPNVAGVEVQQVPQQGLFEMGAPQVTPPVQPPQGGMDEAGCSALGGTVQGGACVISLKF